MRNKILHRLLAILGFTCLGWTIWSSVMEFRTLRVESRTRSDLTTLQASIEAYWIDHDQLPASLENLVAPTPFDPATFRDRFSKNNATLIYETPTSYSWVVRGVGPDGDDDIGAAGAFVPSTFQPTFELLGLRYDAHTFNQYEFSDRSTSRFKNGDGDLFRCGVLKILGEDIDESVWDAPLRAQTPHNMAVAELRKAIVRDDLEAARDTPATHVTIADELHHGPTPLELAVTHNRVAIVRHLLENGANPNHRRLSGDLLLQALITRQIKIAELLVAHGAKISDNSRRYAKKIGLAETLQR